MMKENTIYETPTMQLFDTQDSDIVTNSTEMNNGGQGSYEDEEVDIGNMFT